MSNFDKIEIFIDSLDNILDYRYPQYILNFLANVNPPITNVPFEHNGITYIIYSKINPICAVSDIKIYINDSDLSLNINFVQYINNWLSGRETASENYDFSSNPHSIFNGKTYTINKFPGPEFTNFKIINESTGGYVFDCEDYNTFEIWNNIITSLPPAHISDGTKLEFSFHTFYEAPQENGLITLGYAGPNDTYPITAQNPIVTAKKGVIFINTHENALNNMKATTRIGGKTSFHYFLLHEMGHAFGIGSLWNVNQLRVQDPGDADPLKNLWYNGSNAVREYNSYNYGSGFPKPTGGWLFLPIEDNGGAGTAGGHAEEGTSTAISSTNDRTKPSTAPLVYPALNHELMTGLAEGLAITIFPPSAERYPEPLSRITIGFLEDLGYGVDYTLAEFYDPTDYTNMGP